MILTGGYNRTRIIFHKAQCFLKDDIAPIANELDTQSTLLQKAYKSFVELNSLALMIPAELGGMGGERLTWLRFNRLMARYSGALLFLQGQHQFVVSQLKEHINEPKACQLLQEIVKRNQGIGFSSVVKREHLFVKKEAKGLTLTGTLPWVTGFSFFNRILLQCNDETTNYYVLLPFHASKKDEGRILISPALNTTVCYSANTVKMDLNGYVVEEDDIIVTAPLGDIKLHEHPSVFSFMGLIDAILAIAEQGRFGNESVSLEYYQYLEKERDHYITCVKEQTLESRALRAKGYALVEKCLSFARLSCAALSILDSHPLNRLSREAWQYAVSGYTLPQFEAYMRTLLVSKS